MGSVTSLFARKMVAAAGGEVDAAALLSSVGLEAEGQWDPRAMIPADPYYDMLERIAAQTDATDLPVRVGASMRLNEYGALGLAFKAATTLRNCVGESGAGYQTQIAVFGARHRAIFDAQNGAKLARWLCQTNVT